MKIMVQDLYNIVNKVEGVTVHRGTLKNAANSLIDARHYTPLANITLKYADENGVEHEVNATDTSVVVIRMKILALFVYSEMHDYSRSSREKLKVKLELDTISCSNYMPEIIDGKLREWTVDNLKDAIAAFKK